MAGINPNLGKNLKLQNVQLNSAAMVDVNKTDKQQENIAKPSAVWYVNKDGHIKDNPKYKLGDVLLSFSTGYVYAYRRMMKPDGSLGWQEIDIGDVMLEDYEANRGDLHSPI